MLTLLLVAALCDDAGCIYMDATKKMKITSDYECAQMANFANHRNISENNDVRFACLEPKKYRELEAREI